MTIIKHNDIFLNKTWQKINNMKFGIIVADDNSVSKNFLYISEITPKKTLGAHEKYNYGIMAIDLINNEKLYYSSLATEEYPQFEFSEPLFEE